MSRVQANVAADVAATVQTILGSTVHSTQPLMEAGLDSLGAVELRNALSAKFRLDLPPTVTLDYPSVAALAEYIAAQGAQHAQLEVASPESWDSSNAREVIL